MRGLREDHDVREVLGPAVHRERRGDAGPERAGRLVGADAQVVADDRPELVDDVVVDGALEGDGAHGSIPALIASSSNRSITPMLASCPAVDSGRSDHGQALISVSTSSSAALATRRLADLGRDLRLLDRQPAAAAGAVGPLRDAVHVLEGDAGDRADELPRGLVHALALVQPARVVVGDRALDRVRELDPALLHEVVDQLDAEHDLELVVVREVLGVVLGERDEVVRVGGDDALGADRAPVLDVVLGVLEGEVAVAHLGRRAAAAPLLAHQAELVAGALEELRERARVGGPVERGLAVDEQDRLAADRDVQPVGPVRDVLLADADVAQDRLVVVLREALVPQFPARPARCPCPPSGPAWPSRRRRFESGGGRSRR